MQEAESPTRKTNGRWTKEEHFQFLEGLRVYGKNWKKIQQLVSTRSGSQIRSHAQKFFLKANQINPQQFHTFNFEDENLMEAEEATTNSKFRSEQSTKKEELSFYFSRIRDFLEDGKGLNFWASLVDEKHATENLNKKKNNNSFTLMERTNIQSEDLKGGCYTQL